MQPVEDLEDLLLMLGFDADAVVGDGVHGLAVDDLPGDANATGSRRIGVFHRVVDQVTEQLVDHDDIADAGRQRIDGDLGRTLLDLEPLGMEDLVEQLVHVEGLQDDLDRPDARESQQAVQQHLDLVGAGPDEVQGLGHRVGQQRFDLATGFGAVGGGQQFSEFAAGAFEFASEALDVDQRRAQVVRGGVEDALQFLVFGFEGGQELFALALGELGLGDVPRGGERPDDAARAHP